MHTFGLLNFRISFFSLVKTRSHGPKDEDDLQIVSFFSQVLWETIRVMKLNSDDAVIMGFKYIGSNLFGSRIQK